MNYYYLPNYLYLLQQYIYVLFIHGTFEIVCVKRILKQLFFLFFLSLLHSLLAVAELPFVYKSCVPHLFCLCSEDIMNVKYFIIATRCVQCLFDLWNLLGRNKAITIFFLSVMNQVNILYMQQQVDRQVLCRSGRQVIARTRLLGHHPSFTTYIYLCYQ